MSDASTGCIASPAIRFWYCVCSGGLLLIFALGFVHGEGPADAAFFGTGACLSSVAIWRGFTLRLSWNDEGLTIRNWARTHRVPWAQVRGARSTSMGSEAMTLFRAAVIETAGRPTTAEASASFVAQASARHNVRCGSDDRGRSTTTEELT